MKQFMMQGRAITGPMRYREFFCPQQLLRSRELAAGFFIQQYRFLSDACLYHAEMFYFTTFNQTSMFDFSLPQEYCTDDRVLCNLSQYKQKARLRAYFAQPEKKQCLKEFWQLSREADLPGDDQQRLFCLLTAGYGLAGKTLHDCPITPEQARAAYLRQTADTTATDEGWMIFDLSSAIILPAKQAPYRILMGEGAEELLEQGSVIEPRKIVAAPHVQGSKDVPVTLHLYAGRTDSKPQEVRIAPGDYRYINFVGNVPVWLHPVSVETPSCRMQRMDNTLLAMDAQGNCRTFSCAGLEVIGFAPECEDVGWILLSELGIDYSAYSHRWTYGSFLPDEENPIVQVEFRGAECLLLDKNGYVHSNLYPVSKKRVTVLQAFRRG